MSHPAPSIGRIVTYSHTVFRGSPTPVEYPAIITRVHSDDCVNLTVFTDHLGAPNAGASVWTSVMYDAGAIDNPPRPNTWRWPDRV